MKNKGWNVRANWFVAIAFLSIGFCRAEDSFPPCWRTNATATYQDWTFAVSNNPAPPDDFTNSNGSALATMTVGAFGTGWKSVSLGSRTGLWDLGQAGHATISVPNFSPSASAWKYVYLQVTYYDAPGFYLPPAVVISNATLMSSQSVNNQSVPPGNFKTVQTIWLVQPATNSEFILLNGDSSKGLLIDQMIVDTLLIDFLCPTNLTLVADAGQCSKSNVTWTLPTIDGCVITNISSSPPLGATLPVGTNIISSTITDAQGKSKTCNFQVIVKDNQPPSIQNCPTNRTIKGCQAVVPDVTSEVVATDNCSTNLAITQSPPAGSPLTNLVTPVTIFVQDSASNTVTCNFSITLEPPALTINQSGGSIILSWPPGGTLLQAGDVTGPWNPVPGATPPYSIPGPLLARNFYRLLCN